VTEDREDFEFDVLPPLDGRAGPAEPAEPERARAVVHAAIEAASSSRRASSRPVTTFRRRVAFALAAAFALLVGAAFAARLTRSLSRAPAPALSETAEPARARASPSSAPVAPAAEPSLAPPVESAAPTPVAPPATSSQSEPPASDLLRRANDLRIEHRWAEAEATYERVIARAPRTDESYAAEVAAASIRLEHLNDPKRALLLDRRALAEHPNGALDEEALFGVAEAERAIGDARAEAEALRELVAAHPSSLTRPVAERRLSELARLRHANE